MAVWFDSTAGTNFNHKKLNAMNEKLYDAIISHANTNIHKGGSALFDSLELIDIELSEQMESRSMAKHGAMDRLNLHREYIMKCYARKNNLI